MSRVTDPSLTPGLSDDVEPPRPRWRVALAGLWPLLACVGLLQVSQVLLLPPGTSASPWDEVTFGLTPIRYGPFTAQEWALAAVAAVSLMTWASATGTRLDRFSLLMLTCFGAVAVPAIFTTPGVQAYGEALGKLLLPLMVYAAIRTYRGPRGRITVVVTLVNIFVVSQTVLSRIVTGKFSVNTYYIDMGEEYFGYFHHPFAFTGILGVCTLVALQQALAVRKLSLHLALVPVNLWLMYVSQVRTFFLALVCAIAVLALALLYTYRRTFAYAAVAVGGSAVFFVLTRGLLTTERSVADVSSGRFARWVDDLSYFFHTFDPLFWLFGGGGDFVFSVNQSISGVSINSLNFMIDGLLNHGLIGLAALLVAWFYVFRDAHHRDPGPFVAAMAVFVAMSAVVTSPVEFPALGVLMAVGLAAMPSAANRGRGATTSPDSVNVESHANRDDNHAPT